MSLPPEPIANPDLFGHDAAAAQLRDASRGGRLHHGWLVAGPAGVGKATLAWRYARWVMAGMPDGPGTPLRVAPTEPVFRRIAASAHADVCGLAPSVTEKRKTVIISVDEARAVPRFLSMTPAEGGWRVVVIEDADGMNDQAQNALLKTLEEPPARAVLLLTTSAPDRLLPTIRSRVRRLDLFPLDATVMRPLLAGWLPEMPEGDRASLATLSGGCPGRALSLAEGDGLELARDVAAFLDSLPRPDARGLHGLADRIAARRDGSALLTFFELLRDSLARALRAAARGEGAPAWLAGRGLAEWAIIWEALGRIADETDALNLDRKGAVLTGLSRMAAP